MNSVRDIIWQFICLIKHLTHHKNATSVSLLQHFKSLGSRYLRKAKPMFILILLRGLWCFLFASWLSQFVFIFWNWWWFPGGL